ncbi:hypothetical protein BH11ARM2_BH11ARM2_15680 [soil metagenome]
MSPTRILLFGLAGVAFSALMGAGYYKYNGVSARKELDLQFARAKRLGLPATMDEAWGPPIAADRNAAPLYTRLSEHEALFRQTLGKLKSPGAEARVALAGVASDLALFERASALPGCRFTRASGWDARFPEWTTLRTIGDVMDARARFEAADGEPLKAFATLDSVARASAHVAKEPVLIAKLVAGTMQEKALETAQKILAKDGRRADVRAAGRRLVEALGPLPSYKDAMRGEWIFQRQLLESLEAGRLQTEQFFTTDGTDSPQASELRGIVANPGARAGQELYMVRHFLDSYEAAPNDPMDVMGADKAARALDTVIASHDPAATLASTLLPVYSGGGQIAGRSLAQRRTFLGLLSALDTPTPPKHLSVKGTDALDPFTGTSLLYRFHAGEITVWSVGPDGADDGGVLRKGGGMHEDIVAVWPRR